MARAADDLPAPSSYTKRKSDDDGENSSKRPRTRVSFSCGECHRRKQKCDRRIPCSHCLARKVPELCKAYTPGKADQDISARLSRLEHIVEIALPQFCTPDASCSPVMKPQQQRNSMSPGGDGSLSQPEEQDPSGGTLQSGKWFGNSASGSVAPVPVLEQLQRVGASTIGSPSLNDGGLRGAMHTQSSVPQNKARIEAVVADLKPSAVDNWQSQLEEYGVFPDKISELLGELPSMRSSDVLVDYYFNAINWTRYPLCEPEFRAAYTSLGAHIRDGGVGTTRFTHFNDVRFLPLLFIVLAISVRLAPEQIGGDGARRRLSSLRYYWCSRKSLLIASAIQPDSLDVVLTQLLSARFLTFDRRITECWSQLGAAVRTAQALGLHRDGTTMQNMSCAQTEYRRRIWAYLYHADRSYALVLGRPNSIQDEYSSTLPPTNINDLTHNNDLVPLSQPSNMTFVILRHQLAGIIGRIVRHFQQVRDKSSYSEVITLDDELLKFGATLPPHFSFTPDKSLDETFPYIPVHRFLLVTEILFVRIGLHRPYLLRRLKSERYLRSRTACFESAMQDFDVRQACREEMPMETRAALGNAYREFQSVLISGFYFFLEPNGPHAQKMRTILDTFMKNREGARQLDETTRREMKIIEFLRKKASEIESSVASAHSFEQAGEHLFDNQSEQQARLLLGQQASPTCSSTPTNFAPTCSYRNPQDSSGSTPPPFSRRQPVQPLSSSPTLQRLRYTTPGINNPSPAVTSSPQADDDSAAQFLLDHWWNAPVDLSSGAVSWRESGGALFSGWLGDMGQMQGHGHGANLDNADWQVLVNQIHHGH